MNLLSSACQGTFDWMWKTSLSAAILAALVFLVQWMLGKRLTPRLHYALSLLVLIRLLMPALPVSHFSIEKFLPQRARVSQPMFQVLPPVNPAASKTQVTISANSPAPLPVTINPAPGLGFLSALWLSGCFILVILAAWRYLKWVRRVNAGEIISDPKLLAVLADARKDMRVRRQVRIVAVPQVASPAIFGIWNVHLLLPKNFLSGLGDEDLRLIFRHEMAHVRRHDVLLNTIMIVAQFLHWFNPVVWIALHRLRADRESVCDEMVMRHTKAEERVRYGRLLLKLIEEFPSGQRFLPNTAAMVGSQHEIKRRIIMIKNHGKKRIAGAMFAIVAIALLGCASFTHSARSTSSASQPGLTAVTAPPASEIRSANSGTFKVVPMNADGSPPLAYQWYFNANEISNAGTTRTIVANNSSSTASVPNSGDYTVVVASSSNCPPGTTVPVTLTVPTSSGSAVVVVSASNSPPGTTVPVAVGYSVAATGTPLNYQWYTISNLPAGTVASVPDSYKAPSLALPLSNAPIRVVPMYPDTNGSPVVYQWNFNGTNDPDVVVASGYSTVSSLASQLVGTWVLEREDGPQSEPSGVGTRLKNFTGTHWDIIQPDPKTGAIIFNQGGTYKIEGDKYFEHKDFAGENNKGDIGNTGEFMLKIEGGKLIQKGINNPWNEVWKRVQQ